MALAAYRHLLRATRTAFQGTLLTPCRSNPDDHIQVSMLKYNYSIHEQETFAFSPQPVRKLGKASTRIAVCHRARKKPRRASRTPKRWLASCCVTSSRDGRLEKARRSTVRFEACTGMLSMEESRHVNGLILELRIHDQTERGDNEDFKKGAMRKAAESAGGCWSQ